VYLTAGCKRAWSAAVVCVLLILTIFLCSPWHHRPAQGRQACSFFQVEQSGGLEASVCLFPNPPSDVCEFTREEDTPLRGFQSWDHPSLRAPPAAQVFTPAS